MLHSAKRNASSPSNALKWAHPIPLSLVVIKRKPSPTIDVIDLLMCLWSNTPHGLCFQVQQAGRIVSRDTEDQIARAVTDVPAVHDKVAVEIEPLPHDLSIAACVGRKQLIARTVEHAELDGSIGQLRVLAVVDQQHATQGVVRGEIMCRWLTAVSNLVSSKSLVAERSA